MSTVVLGECWPLQLPPVAKSVLISLADNANDHGECWPSIGTICARTCYSRTAVIDAIRYLEDAGLLVADRTNGRHTRYRIVLEHDLFQSAIPVRQAYRSATRTGTAGRRDPSATRTGPVRHADTNHQEPSGTVIGKRLPDDWSPSEELKAQARAESPGVDLDAATMEFRRYWVAQPDPRGRLANWDATWLNRIAQLARASRSNGSATPSQPAPREYIKPPELTPDQAYTVEVEQLDLLLAGGLIDEAEHDRRLAEAAARRRKECEKRPAPGSSPGVTNAGTGSAKTRQPRNDPKGVM